MMFRTKFLRKKVKAEERKDRVNNIIGAVEAVKRLFTINELARLVALLRTIQRLFYNSHLKF